MKNVVSGMYTITQQSTFSRTISLLAYMISKISKNPWYNWSWNFQIYVILRLSMIFAIDMVKSELVNGESGYWRWCTSPQEPQQLYQHQRTKPVSIKYQWTSNNSYQLSYKSSASWQRDSYFCPLHRSDKMSGWMQDLNCVNWQLQSYHSPLLLNNELLLGKNNHWQNKESISSFT